LNRKELADKKVRDLFDAAMDKKDHSLLRKALGSVGSMDVVYFYVIKNRLNPDVTWIKDAKLSSAIKLILREANKHTGANGETYSVDNSKGTDVELGNRSGIGV
jgi:hypothetical protein